MSVLDLTEQEGVWLRRYGPAVDSGLSLVCFPHAGAAASAWQPLTAHVAPPLDLLAVQYPGRQDRRREPVRTRVEVLADELAAVLLPLAGQRPMALFGHSMGATVAYEVTLRLQAVGVEPVALIVSGRRAPSTYRDDRIHLRDDHGLVDAIRSLGGTDLRVLDDEEMVQMILPAVRGDYTAIETYRAVPDTAVHCPLIVLNGTEDPQVTRQEAEAWREHTTAACTVRWFPGGHFYLNGLLPQVAQAVIAGLGVNFGTTTRV